MKISLFYRPDIPRPIKVHTALPVIFIICCIVLVLMPSLTQPMNLLIGIAITLAGIPFYYLCIAWKDKPKSYGRISGAIVNICRALFNTTIIEGNDEIKH